MGEVYRADDLKLGQQVALKFLPDDLARDPSGLQRFLSEVRLARQVSHPNVCRVYDAGEIDGRHFLTMEYVDGEDLASLLRRIGRLPRDKAVEIARQICAGLHAAHERGVLHRDLKPANVMIDGRGKARLTDFGLAVLASDVGRGTEGAAARAVAAGPGTPAYMAPEQLEGRDASARSDLFALGLVLYEMFTGKRAFDAATMPELARLHQESTPASPRNIVDGIDPAIERAILRCLDKDPRLRPPSALAVAAALPGGDPLAAALAAGETPSPEMVAGAAVEGSLRRAIAWACLLGVLAALVLQVAASSRTKAIGRAAFDKPPDVLAERARAVLARFGHTRPAADALFGFDDNQHYMKYLQKHDKTLARFDDLAPIPGAAPFVFWYRQSPGPLLAKFPSFVTEMSEPPSVAPGSAIVVLDTKGRLLRLEVIPSQDEPPAVAAVGSAAPGAADPLAATRTPDWSTLFAEAELDPASFTPAPSDRLPPVFCDARASWRGALRGRPGVTLNVDAGAYGGRPVYFRVAGPWDEPVGEGSPSTPRSAGTSFLTLIVQIPVLVVGGLLARRNLRLGRGDRAGAFRIAVYFLVAHMGVWALWAHHVPSLIDEWDLLVQGLSWTLYNAAIIWLLYIALEPFVRRVTPGSIVSWSRLLTGHPRDPLVGRDILVGCLGGALICMVVTLADLVFGWLGLPRSPPGAGNAIVLLGPRYALALPLDIQLHGMLDVMSIFVLFLLCRIMFRLPWLATTAFYLTLATPIVMNASNPVIDIPTIGICLAIVTFLLIRRGLLALIASFFVVQILMIATPLTNHLTAWYAQPTLISVVAVGSVAAWSFRVALAGRPMFRPGLLQD